MLKEFGFVFLGVLFSLSLQAQMGVGTDMPDPAAELEIKSANRGLLIPRIQLDNDTDQTTITAGNIESLLVYNTTSNATLQQGFYYWYNNKWRRLSDEDNLPEILVIWDENSQIFTYIDSNDNFQEIDLDFDETLTTLEMSADGKNLIYTDEEAVETTIDLEAVIQQYETLTSLVDNENGTISYFDEIGEETIINLGDATETLTYLVWNQDDNQLIYTDENGDETAINLPELIQQYETLTSLEDNEDGTISYFDEAGAETTINLEASQQVHITSTDYQPDMDDRIILGDAEANDITITLPDPADFEGRKFTIKKEDNNEDYYLNVSGTIAGIPAGEELYTALPHTGWDLVSDGTAWRIVNKF